MWATVKRFGTSTILHLFPLHPLLYLSLYLHNFLHPGNSNTSNSCFLCFPFAFPLSPRKSSNRYPFITAPRNVCKLFNIELSSHPSFNESIFGLIPLPFLRYIHLTVVPKWFIYIQVSIQLIFFSTLTVLGSKF